MYQRSLVYNNIELQGAAWFGKDVEGELGPRDLWQTFGLLWRATGIQRKQCSGKVNILWLLASKQTCTCIPMIYRAEINGYHVFQSSNSVWKLWLMVFVKVEITTSMLV